MFHKITNVYFMNFAGTYTGSEILQDFQFARKLDWSTDFLSVFMETKYKGNSL